MNNARASRADRNEQCLLENQLIREMHGIRWNISSILFSFINNGSSLCSNYACVYNDWWSRWVNAFHRESKLREIVAIEISESECSRNFLHECDRVLSLLYHYSQRGTDQKRLVKRHIELFSLKSEKIRATRSDF